MKSLIRPAILIITIILLTIQCTFAQRCECGEEWNHDIQDCDRISPLCDDSNCANGVEWYNEYCDCIPGTPLNCDDNDCSTIDSVNNSTCSCVNTPNPNLPLNCNDGICFNGVETYNTSTCACVPGVPPTNPGCDDGICSNGLEFWDGCACVNGEHPTIPNCDDGICINGLETYNATTCSCIGGTPPIDPGCDDGDCSNGIEYWDGCECVNEPSEVSNDTDDVYPGDVNHDGIVNNRDVGLSGLHLFTAELARVTDHQNISWYPHPADDWSNIINGVNLKHFDCDGDGAITPSDHLAIEENMGLRWKPLATYPSSPEQSDYLVLTFPTEEIYDGYLIMNVALERRTGESLTLQGGHFTIDFSGIAGDFQDVLFNFEPSSWLGIPNSNLVYTNEACLSNRILEVGFSKKNGNNSIGNGVIGQLILEYNTNVNVNRLANGDNSQSIEVIRAGAHDQSGTVFPIQDKMAQMNFNNNGCPTDLLITEDSPFQNEYKSTNLVKTDGFVIIGKDQQVKYQANHIQLNSGFIVRAGADFEVNSAPCQ